VAADELFKVPKQKKQVSLWVHPEGRVIGSIYILEQSALHAGPEEPIEALNQDSPFVVISMEDPSELRFYNRTSVIRVEYQGKATVTDNSVTQLTCQVHLMDGSMIDGQIIEVLPQSHSRTFDYLNQDKERFIKIYTDTDEICLINKSYINYVTTVDE
jgi:hypothetical protein